MITERKVDEYLKEGRAYPGYTDIEEYLDKVLHMSPKIKYVYVYRVEPDGTHVVFDIDTPEVKADEVGDVLAYDESITKHLDKFLAGEEIPAICRAIPPRAER